MQTIIHVIDSLGLGGAEILLKNTINLLPDFDHVVVYLHEPSDLNVSFDEAVEIICLQHKGWGNLPYSVIKLKRILKEKKPIIVHSHLFYSTICARLAVPSTIPLVSTIHSLFSKDTFEKNFLSIWAERLTLKKRHALVGVSNCVLEDYLKFISFVGKRFVLYNFLPDSSFYAGKRLLNSSTYRCVAVGNLKEAKNYFYLLEIFKILKPLDISLDIFGTGSMEELSTFIKTEKLNVRLCGETDNVLNILQEYNFFIQASSHEGFGLSVIEAMATQVPLIVSDIPVFREITDGLAYFFPLGNAEKAAIIIKSVMDKQKSTVFVAKAYTFVQTNYSAKRYRDKLLAIYKDITQENLRKCVE